MTSQSPDAVFLRTMALAMSTGAGIVFAIAAANPACLALCLGIGGCLAALR